MGYCGREELGITHHARCSHPLNNNNNNKACQAPSASGTMTASFALFDLPPPPLLRCLTIRCCALMQTPEQTPSYAATSEWTASMHFHSAQHDLRASSCREYRALQSFRFRDILRFPRDRFQDMSARVFRDFHPRSVLFDFTVPWPVDGPHRPRQAEHSLGPNRHWLSRAFLLAAGEGEF